jgi:hypothetical protein
MPDERQEPSNLAVQLEQIVALVRAANLSLDSELDGPDVGHILDVATPMFEDVIPAIEAVALQGSRSHQIAGKRIGVRIAAYRGTREIAC